MTSSHLRKQHECATDGLSRVAQIPDEELGHLAIELRVGEQRVRDAILA